MATPSTLDGHLTVARMLDASTLTGSRVLAGERGLERQVQRLNVMEVPDILPWVKPHEFLLTTAYPLREVPAQLVELVDGLDDRGLAGMGIKVGRYLDAIPEPMLERAEERGFPIVRLPDNVGFDDILDQVLTDILNRQAGVLARSEEAHRALLGIVLSGGGLPEVARVLADLLSTPVMVTDASGQTLAEARVEEARSLLVEAGVLGHDGQVLIDRQADGETWGAPHPGAVADPRGAADPDAADPQARVLSVAIHAGARLHGHIVAVSTDRVLDGGDLLAVRNAATVAALVVTQEEAVAAVEGKYASDFLHDLLAGRLTDAADALNRGAALGWDVARDLVVLVVAPAGRPRPGDGSRGGLDPLTRIAAGARAAVLPRDDRAAVVRLSGEVVVLAGAEAVGPPGREAAKRLGRVLAEEASAHAAVPVSVGISRAVSGPCGVDGAYRQAARALRIGREIGGDAAVSHFDDLGIYRVLSLVEDREELQAYAAEALGPLADDNAEAAELRRTLSVVLEESLNIAASARRLHFHYNTLRYRVDKLERLVGPFTRDQRLRLDLQVALRVLELRALAR